MPPGPYLALFSMSHQIVTLTGELGSGKSSVSKSFAALRGWRRYAAGDAQRQIAKERGMTTLELNVLAETDTSIDKEIDGVFASLQERGENLVVDSRMAWFFLPFSMKVRLVVSIDEAANRIHGDQARISEDRTTLDNTFQDILLRKKSEKRRFKRYYGVDIDEDANYDFVISTDMADVVQTAGLISCLADIYQAVPSLPKYWTVPQNLFPTHGIETLSRRDLADICLSVAEKGFDPMKPVEIVARNHDYFIANGHKRVCAALATHTAFVPISIVGEGAPCLEGRTIEKFLRDAEDQDRISAWEDMHRFKFNRRVF